MKESILDVLLYLFEHCFDEASDLVRDRDSLQLTLLDAGFSPTEIHKAFAWLDGLAEQRPAGHRAPGSTGPVRVFAPEEFARLSPEGVGFLVYLEQSGVLTAEQREWVLDRALALDQDELDLDDLKWVVLMVLFNQPGAEEAYAWMESLMFGDDTDVLH